MRAVCDILSHMMTVTYREFVAQKKFRRLVAAGRELLVTERGKPFFRALPPEKPATHKGAAAHLYAGQAVSHEPLSAEEWGGLE